MHQLTFENEFVDTTSEYILNLSSIMMPKPHYSSHEGRLNGMIHEY